MTPSGERRGQGGLAGPRWPDEGDGLLPEGNGARVQTGDPSKSQNEGQDGTEQIRGDVVESPRLGPAGPDRGAQPVDHELGAVGVVKPEELTRGLSTDGQQGTSGLIPMRTDVDEILRAGSVLLQAGRQCPEVDRHVPRLRASEPRQPGKRTGRTNAQSKHGVVVHRAPRARGRA